MNLNHLLVPYIQADREASIARRRLTAAAAATSNRPRPTGAAARTWITRPLAVR